MSFLLPKSDSVVDTELDALFKATSIKPVEKKVEANTTHKPKADDTDAGSKKQKKKRKAEESAEPPASPAAGPSSSKKLKTKAVEEQVAERSTPSQKSSKKEKKAKVTSTIVEEPAPQPKPSKKSKKASKKPVEVSSDDEDDNSDIENAYLAGRQSRDAKKAQKEDSMDVDGDGEGADGEEGGEEEDDDESSPANLVHESLLEGASKSKKSGSGKQKFVPEDETPERRDQRTVFIGNIPLAVASKRPLQKQLQKHILAFVPSAKIESVRFRSVPFQNPTSKLPTSDDESAPSQSKTTPKPRTTDRPSNHASERASSWRSKLDAKDEDAVKTDVKSYLTPGQKKKIAFIHHEFHGEADSVNAYVVFAHPVPQDTRPKNLPPLPEVMDPYEAAKVAADKCNNTVFMERIIRVDRVGVKGKKVVPGDEEEGAAPLMDADPKFTIFVGNLDFASKEEDLRAFFENLVVSEKGPAPTTGEEDLVEGVKKAAAWVVRVRIVRDKETQLGKGFAYVQFSDKECVDEILALEETKLKLAKRKLRVQRCKTLPGSQVKVKATPKPKTKDGKAAPGKRPATPIVVPKGDPTLGERLAHLPKIVRKQAKAADGDRIARRLAKKKARMAMGPPKESKDGGRDRTRKSVKGTVNTGKKSGKPRVRNEKNAKARNAKK